ncbi:MAG: hypothetical protein K0S08_873 [Gammaproteobacteria bacterium]|nr:hypothetical protein [Gammaproteobacteria bacterium]
MPATTGVVMVLIMMWATKPIFAVVVLIWLVLHMSFTAIFMRYGNHLWEVQSEAGSVLSGKIVDVLTNMLNVRLFARGNYEMEYLKTYQADEIKKSQKAQWAIELVRIGLGISGLFLIFSMMFLLIYGYAHHWVTLGDFTQVSMQSFWILGWIWFLSYQVSMFAREMGVVKNALTLIIQPHSIIDHPQAKPLQINHGKIRFDHVTFAYQKDQSIFNDLQVEILPGKKIGLVGFSGSGKSTFVNLILRFYEPQQGSIFIDEQNIADVAQDSLRAQIAMIPQDPMLFHRSLMENIRYGRLEASDEEVIEASKLAHCHEFIEQLDEKYAALVGERGVKLSGGQRQRIAIARAILKKAPILILDEATSALDSVTEKLIQQSLQHLMKNCTTLVIAHRLSTLSNMDELLVFDQGKIIECGTQAKLLAANGHFAHLWKMQADGFLPE